MDLTQQTDELADLFDAYMQNPGSARAAQLPPVETGAAAEARLRLQAQLRAIEQLQCGIQTCLAADAHRLIGDRVLADSPEILRLQGAMTDWSIAIGLTRRTTETVSEVLEDLLDDLGDTASPLPPRPRLK